MIKSIYEKSLEIVQGLTLSFDGTRIKSHLSNLSKIIDLSDNKAMPFFGVSKSELEKIGDLIGVYKQAERKFAVLTLNPEKLIEYNIKTQTDSLYFVHDKYYAKTIFSAMPILNLEKVLIRINRNSKLKTLKDSLRLSYKNEIDFIGPIILNSRIFDNLKIDSLWTFTDVNKQEGFVIKKYGYNSNSYEITSVQRLNYEFGVAILIAELADEWEIPK